MGIFNQGIVRNLGITLYMQYDYYAYINRVTSVSPMSGTKQTIQPDEISLATIAQIYYRLKGWETYPEVAIPIFGGRPDFAATKGKLVLVAEVKRSLSYTVIEQLTRWHLDYEAARRSTYRDANVLGIPNLLVAIVYDRQNISSLKRDILQRNRIGVISLISEGRPVSSLRRDPQDIVIFDNTQWRVVEEIEPRIQCGSRNSAHNIIKHLNPDMRCATAGASGRAGGYMTPFKRTMGNMWQYLAHHPLGSEIHIASVVAFLNKAGGHHYTNDAGAKQSLLSALERDGIQHRYCRFNVPDTNTIALMQQKYPSSKLDVDFIMRKTAQLQI